MMFKILSKNKQNDEIWKSAWEYYHDEEDVIKGMAIEIIFGQFNYKNFQNIIESILNEEGD